MTDNGVVKKGKFGRPKYPSHFPNFVRECIDRLIREDVDWMMPNDKGQEWILVKCWIDDSQFEIIAGKVEYQSQIIKDGEEYKFGRPKYPSHFPNFVRECIDRLIREDVDWMMPNDKGQEWILVKCWIDDSQFEIIAGKVEYQSQIIKDGEE